MTSTTIDSVNSTYDYNGDGLRMSRTIGATTVDYVRSESGGLPSIPEDSAGTRYVYGLDMIARIDGSTEESSLLLWGLRQFVMLASVMKRNPLAGSEGSTLNAL